MRRQYTPANKKKGKQNSLRIAGASNHLDSPYMPREPAVRLVYDSLITRIKFLFERER